MGWIDLLRNGEIRVVSRTATGPYAVTVLYLSGPVIVQLEERFWRETPGPLREEALRAHGEQVRAEFLAMGSPAALAGTAALATRAFLVVASGGFTEMLGVSSPTLYGVLTAAVWMVPRRLILWPVRVWLRRLLSRIAHR